MVSNLELCTQKSITIKKNKGAQHQITYHHRRTDLNQNRSNNNFIRKLLITLFQE